MPSSLKSRFGAVFTGKKRISAQEWGGEMRSYWQRILQGKSSREYCPTLFLDISKLNEEDETGENQVIGMQEFICPICKEKGNKARDLYEKDMERGVIPRCLRCEQSIRALRSFAVEVTCGQCGAPVSVTMGRLDELAQKRRPVLCESCLKKQRESAADRRAAEGRR